MKKNPIISKTGLFNPRVLLAFMLCSAGVSLALLGFAAPTKIQPAAGQAVSPVVSAPVRQLPTNNAFTDWSDTQLADLERPLKGRETSNPNVVDPVVQIAAPTAGMPSVGVSFEGIDIAGGCGGCLPPDPNGAVGPNHYVQMVNTSFAVYNKTTGAVMTGPTKINQLWSVTPNSECAQRNDGDPIVVYDQLADRWLLSQFTSSAAPNYAQCIAVSTSPDPAGSYYLYEFDESPTVFHDYPKIGVWPDAYYMSSNEFPANSQTNSGAGAFAFERAKMLAGQPARFVWFDETCAAPSAFTPGGQNPTNLDGRTLPPSGAPNYFVETDNPPTSPSPTATGSVMSIWKFHVDWSDPTKSTMGTGSTAPVDSGGGLFKGTACQPDFIIPVANYVVAQCVYGEGPNCVPEKLSPPLQPATLDTLGDRIMFRATYRNFGDHESLVVSHTSVTTADVMTGATRTGVRWYELRNLSTTPTVYQQSTFAPLDPTNPIWRWMGSAAMDHSGDIAVGYSASGPNYFPSVHYAGRLVTDPLNELTQGEAVMFVGLGIQAFPLDRWGDYSDLTVDPTDDCTFWYTNEYNDANTTTDLLPVKWRTRIGSFRFPQCVSAANVPLTSVVSRMIHGSAGTFDINLFQAAALCGPAGCPRGVECRSSGSLGVGNYTLLFTFANNLVSVGSASVTGHDPAGGTGTTCGSSMGPALNQYTVNLCNVSDAQYITVTLNSVADTAGNSGSVVSPQMGVLIGDTNADGFVNSADISQTKSQSGQLVGASNFREDLNTDGFLNSADISLVKSKSGTALPSTP
jgi:hypothetical protein